MGTRVFRRCPTVFLPASRHVPVDDVLSRLAITLSAPFARADDVNLAAQDALNARLAWLWWPVGPPAPERPMPVGAHGLYVVHAWLIARAARIPRGGRWALATLASWALFTGAWDRRARRC